MTSPNLISLMILLVMGFAYSAAAVTYYAATYGDDSYPGSSALPWRSIQKAANTLLAGDTVMVLPGEYSERATTSRGGASESNRITFLATGTVVMRGFIINHAYITVRGFEITGHSAASISDAHVRVNSGGDHFEMSDCVVRDGVQITRSDIAFNFVDGTINSAAGGFLTAGFASGQTLWVGAAAAGVSINSLNAGMHTITSVTDNAIKVDGILFDEGPLSVYLSASLVYGLGFSTGAESCVIRNNTFRNLGYDSWFIVGTGHLLEGNIIEQANGWDAMHFGGTNHVFRGNLIHSSPLCVYQISPDAMENYSPAPYSNVLFTNNFIQGFVGVLASQKNQNTMSDLLITHNVFVDVGRFSLTHPNTTIENNTFLRVSKEHSAVNSRASHPVFVNSAVGATNVVLRNNIFVDCGEPSTSQSLSDVGWYEIGGPANLVICEGNFVAGSPPDYSSKTGWYESALLNGGEPGFVNLSDPLGPDGRPFTDDDGLRLRADSRLRGAGLEGLDLGAYQTYPMPVLQISWALGDFLRISWPSSAEGFVLESLEEAGGAWTDLDVTPSLEGDVNTVSVRATNSMRFFRLRR